MRLLNRRALITGGSRGIGRAIAEAFAAEGCDVAVSYLTSEAPALELAEHIRSAGRKAVALRADLAEPRDVIRLCEEAVRELGGLDILVNCAGVMQNCPISELKEAEWNRILTTNLTSAYLAVQTCLDALKESRCGRIISISSQAALTGSRNRVAYCASKSGLLGLTYALAKEFGPLGITVNAISPGRIVTDMIRGDFETRAEEWLAATPLRRFGLPEEVGSAAVFLASDDAAYITGLNLHVNGGLLMG